MSLTPTLFNEMDFEHAVNALRHELGTDFAWLTDWIESQMPAPDAMAIITQAEDYGFSATDIDALGSAHIESVAHTCAVLAEVEEYKRLSPSDVGTALAMHARLGLAGYTTLDGLEALLESTP